VTSTVFSGNKAYCHVLPLFPPVHIHTVFDFGETITTERKSDALQPESVLLSGNDLKIKGENLQ
jgi:hypothetical protein